MFNGGYIFVKFLNNIFFKQKVEEFLARDQFYKRKTRSISIRSWVGRLLIEWPSNFAPKSVMYRYSVKLVVKFLV